VRGIKCIALSGSNGCRKKERKALEKIRVQNRSFLNAWAFEKVSGGLLPRLVGFFVNGSKGNGFFDSFLPRFGPLCI
jgi:hypothetical protein